MKSRLIAVAIHKSVICGNDRFAPILLQKSFLGDERNFLGPLSVSYVAM